MNEYRDAPYWVKDTTKSKFSFDEVLAVFKDNKWYTIVGLIDIFNIKDENSASDLLVTLIELTEKHKIVKNARDKYIKWKLNVLDDAKYLRYGPLPKYQGFSKDDILSLKYLIRLIPTRIRNQVKSLTGINPIIKTEGRLIHDLRVKNLIPPEELEYYKDAIGLYFLNNIDRIFVDSETGIDTFFHEIGHGIYREYLCQKQWLIEEWKRLDMYYLNYGYLINPRVIENPSEHFAYSFSYYIQYPKRMKFNYPRSYKFFKKKIFFGNESTKIVLSYKEIILAQLQASLKLSEDRLGKRFFDILEGEPVEIKDHEIIGHINDEGSISAQGLRNKLQIRRFDDISKLKKRLEYLSLREMVFAIKNDGNIHYQINPENQKTKKFLEMALNPFTHFDWIVRRIKAKDLEATTYFEYRELFEDSNWRVRLEVASNPEAIYLKEFRKFFNDRSQEIRMKIASLPEMTDFEEYLLLFEDKNFTVRRNVAYNLAATKFDKFRVLFSDEEYLVRSAVAFNRNATKFEEYKTLFYDKHPEVRRDAAYNKTSTNFEDYQILFNDKDHTVRLAVANNIDAVKLDGYKILLKDFNEKVRLIADFNHRMMLNKDSWPPVNFVKFSDSTLSEIAEKSENYKVSIFDAEIIQIFRQIFVEYYENKVIYIIHIKGGYASTNGKKSSPKYGFKEINIRSSSRLMTKNDLKKGDVINFNGKFKIDQELGDIVHSIRKIEKNQPDF